MAPHPKGPTPRQDRGRQKSAPTWVLHPPALVIAIWSIDRKSAGKSAYATTESPVARLAASMCGDLAKRARYIVPLHLQQEHGEVRGERRGCELAHH